MENHKPFTITTSVPDGRADGLRIVQKSNWVGRAVICPRSIVMEKKFEFTKSGVYILRGEQDELVNIYIGESENVLERIKGHLKDKDFWESIVMFTTDGEPLNKAQVMFLESSLIDLAKASKRCELQNNNSSPKRELSMSDSIEIEGYLVEMLSLLPMLGLDVFEKAEPQKRNSTEFTYFSESKGWKARGQEMGAGFVVLKGSVARKKTVQSLEKHNNLIIKLRDMLIEKSILVETDDKNHYKFSEDYKFNSPSQAASVCSGTNDNGREVWRDKHGRSLNDIAKEQAKE